MPCGHYLLSTPVIPKEGTNEAIQIPEGRLVSFQVPVLFVLAVDNTDEDTGRTLIDTQASLVYTLIEDRRKAIGDKADRSTDLANTDADIDNNSSFHLHQRISNALA